MTEKSKETNPHSSRQGPMGEEPLAAIGWLSGPEQLHRDLTGLLLLLLANPVPGTPVFAALEALSMIGEYWWSDEAPVSDRDPESGLPLQSFVHVPWWVVQALGHAFAEYNSSPPGTPLGKAFGLDGKGQGNVPTKSTLDRKLRDLKLALEVQHALAPVPPETRQRTQTAAIAAVADRFALGERVVRRAWTENREFARNLFESKLAKSSRPFGEPKI